MAVPARPSGASALLLAAAEDLAAELAGCLWATARVRALGLYQRSDWVVVAWSGTNLGGSPPLRHPEDQRSTSTGSGTGVNLELRVDAFIRRVT